MKRVLLADDSVAARKSIQTVLEVAGIDVVAVGNGDLALSRLDEVEPEMVLIDVIMPGRNGYDVCAEIKSNPKYSKLPVLLITSEFEPYDEQLAEISRADGHLIKPLDITALAVMRQVLKKYAPEDADGLAGNPESTTPAGSSRPPMPAPDSFITSTTMRVADIEAAQAKALAASTPVEDTIPSGSGVRSKQSDGWSSAVPDHVVEVTDAPVGHMSPLRRAPTTENLEHDIAAAADERAREAAGAGLRSVSIDDLHAAGERCSACNATLVPGDIFCISCGAMVLVTTEEEQQLAKPPQCAECRQELIPGEIFCVSCGAVV